MFIYAFVIIAGLCMLVIPCVLLHHVLAHNRHSKWHTAAIITFVIVALAGSIVNVHPPPVAKPIDCPTMAAFLDTF